MMPDRVQLVMDPDDAREPVESVGPIEFLSVAFIGNQFKGEILPELERLKIEGIVRIIDLLLVRKDSIGAVMVTTASDLDWNEAVELGSYLGGLAAVAAVGPAGLERGAMAGAAQLADGHFFDDDDLFRVTQTLPENMSAALVLLEHLWAKPLYEAVGRAGGITLGKDWLEPEEVFTPARLAAHNRPLEPGHS
jgi:uncharacterized membrane protein